MNLRYDDTVHAVNDEGMPLCGSGIMPACAPERTTDDVTCWECQSIVG